VADLKTKKKQAKPDRQISWAQRTNKWAVAYYFSYNILKFTDQYFFVMLILFTKNLLETTKKKSLLIALGGWLEKKNR